jgi:hypothetical protein
VGYDFDEPLPDHSSLTRIRTRLGLAVFQRFFAHVVELCQAAGLIWGNELIFDATKVRANAAVDSLVPRWYLAAKTHLDDLFADAAASADASAVSDAAPSVSSAPPPSDAPRSLPFRGPPAAEQHLASANRSTWQLLNEYRLNPQRPASCSYRRVTDLRVSTTDPDAAPMRAHLGDRPTLGYHDHYMVDGGKARIILAAFVTPADVMENTPMLDLLHRVRFRWHLHPQQAVGDTTYGTIDTIRAVEDAGIRAYVPLPDFAARTPFSGASRFTSDPDHDVYRCPQGKVLPRRSTHYTLEVVRYRAAAADCNACPVKQHCTNSRRGRQVVRSFSAAYLERVRRYHETEPYRKAMRKRQVWVEPLFGEAKDWHGLRRFRLRGLWKVNCEGVLVAAGQNLKRWLTAMGWGRRHGPAGSLALRRIASPPTGLAPTP